MGATFPQSLVSWGSGCGSCEPEMSLCLVLAESSFNAGSPGLQGCLLATWGASGPWRCGVSRAAESCPHDKWNLWAGGQLEQKQGKSLSCNGCCHRNRAPWEPVCRGTSEPSPLDMRGTLCGVLWGP